MHASRWSWLPLLACAAAAGAAAQTPQPADRPAGEEQEADTGSRRWVLPPLRTNGSLAYDYRMARGSGAGSASHLVTASVGLETFIYAPWLATVSGSLGASGNWTRENGAQSLFTDGLDESLHERIRARGQFVTGNGRLYLFPLSKFPFELHVSRDDSRNDSGLGTVLAFRTQNIGFSQQYQPAGGGYRISGRYDHNEQVAFGLRGKQDSFSGDFSTSWKHHSLGLGASHSRARDVGTDNDSRFATLVMRHDYAPAGSLSVNSTVNWTRARELATAAANDLQMLQWSSVGLWRHEPTGLSVTGSARALALREEAHGNAVDAFGATLGASYEITPRLRLSANGGLGTTRTDGRAASSANAGASLGYQSESLNFAGASYHWFATGSGGASLASASESEGGRHADLNLQVGHSVTRPVSLAGQEIVLAGTQSLGWSHAWSSREFEGVGGLGSSRHLLNTISATWQRPGNASSLYVRTMYSDALNMQETSSRFRMFNFQVSGGLVLDNQRSFSGDLTYQRTWQRAGSIFQASGFSESGRATQSSVSGEINYRHVNLFDVPRLQFTSRVKLAQDVLKQPGSLLSLPDRETGLWENRLTWSIGRLDTDVSVRVSRIDGQLVRSVMFRVQRTFAQ